MMLTKGTTNRLSMSQYDSEREATSRCLFFIWLLLRSRPIDKQMMMMSTNERPALHRNVAKF